MFIVASLDKEIRKIIMAGLGAISNTVEKSKDAIEEFVHSDGVKNMAEKGEDVFHSAVELGRKAVDKVKDTFTEAEIEQKVREEKERLIRLAREIRQLGAEERKLLDRLVDEGEGTAFTGEEGIGQPGVTDSPYDLEINPQTYRPVSVDPYDLSPDHPSPTSPDDDANTAKVKTKHMNKHIPQNVPPEY